MNFNHFDLNRNILKALEENNYTKTTSIQEKVIPLILKGEDILAKSQTGSGKTASFVLPILNQFIEDEKVKIKKKAFISTIILTPTRDLTIQVAQTFELFSKHLDKKHPWDRMSECFWLMEPVWIDYKKNKWNMIQHRCKKCWKEILDRVAPDDNFLDFIKKINMQ